MFNVVKVIAISYRLYWSMQQLLTDVCCGQGNSYQLMFVLVKAIAIN